jgi:hypothetical protein
VLIEQAENLTVDKEKIFTLGLYSVRRGGYIGRCESAFSGRLRIPVEPGWYYPRLERLFEGVCVVPDTLEIHKLTDATTGEWTTVEEIDINDIGLHELGIVNKKMPKVQKEYKEKKKGGLKRVVADPDYKDENAEDLLLRIPENKEICLANPRRTNLLFCRVGFTVQLTGVEIGSYDVLTPVNPTS